MDGQLIIMQGGEDVKKRTNAPLFRNVGELSATKRVLVIAWTSDSMEKEAEYRTIFNQYFSENEFNEVLFLEKTDDDTTINEKLSSVDVIYLPGGDPSILYHELEIRSLQERLRSFKGILIGNSAGAIVLSRGTRKGEQFYPGFGLVDFFVKVHYKFEKGSQGTEEKLTINIPEDMWITVTR